MSFLPSLPSCMLWLFAFCISALGPLYEIRWRWESSMGSRLRYLVNSHIFLKIERNLSWENIFLIRGPNPPFWLIMITWAEQLFCYLLKNVCLQTMSRGLSYGPVTRQHTPNRFCGTQLQAHACTQDGRPASSLKSVSETRLWYIDRLLGLL